MSRILAVDPGDKRIGLALSDPTRMIATPLETILHVSREADAESILKKAQTHDVISIIVGVAYDDEGNVGPQARKALRLIETLEQLGDIPVKSWDESGSTQAARRQSMPDPDLDSRAAAVILQDYLDAQSF
jgi:putative Holliday junction resolvase